MFPNFYNGLKQHSVFFLFSITESSGLPRNIHTYAQNQSEFYNSVEQDSKNVQYQKPSDVGFNLTVSFSGLNPKEHKTQA